MAKAKKFSIEGVNGGVELMQAFNEYNALPAEKREKLEKETDRAKIVFYPTNGIVWIGFKPVNQSTGEIGKAAGKYHSLALNKEHAAYEQFRDKEGNRKSFHHYTWTADSALWYTDKNVDLVKALGSAF